MTRWRTIDTIELAALNAALKSAGVDPNQVTSGTASRG